MGEAYDMYGAYPDFEPYVHSYNPADGDWDPLDPVAELCDRYEAGERLSEMDFDRIRHASHSAVEIALKKGKLVKTPCLHCASTEQVEGHHRSYRRSDWLDVAWLCRRCHLDEHDKLPPFRLALLPPRKRKRRS